jgi:hypothetical protein
MGANCSCINKDERQKDNSEMNINRIKELSINYIIIANKIKNNQYLLYSLVKIQSRFRGLIVRNKVKSGMRTHKFMPNDSTNRFTEIKNNSRIVILINLD